MCSVSLHQERFCCCRLSRSLVFRPTVILIHASLRLRSMKNKLENKIEGVGLKKTPMGVILDLLDQQEEKINKIQDFLESKLKDWAWNTSVSMIFSHCFFLSCFLFVLVLVWEPNAKMEISFKYQSMTKFQNHMFVTSPKSMIGTI